MKSKVFKIKAKYGNCMNLYVLGDLHFGSEAFLKDKWNKVCNIIKKDPLAYTIVLGDITDDDRPSTRKMRIDMFSDRAEAYKQEDNAHYHIMDRFVIPELLKAINPKRCLGIFDGDHYRRYLSGMTSVQYICATKKIEYLGDGEADIDLLFEYSGRNIQKVINARHGRGFNKSPSLVMRRIEDIAGGYEGYDIFLRGHAHTPGAIPIARTYRDRNKHKRFQRDIILVNTMSFRAGAVEGRTDYAEQREYKPTAYYLPVLKFNVEKIDNAVLVNVDILEKYI